MIEFFKKIGRLFQEGFPKKEIDLGLGRLG